MMYLFLRKLHGLIHTGRDQVFSISLTKKILHTTLIVILLILHITFQGLPN